MNNPNSSQSKVRHNAEACEHCQGLTDHEPWCVTRDPSVCYAYQIVAEASKMTYADTLILHSLGVTWAETRP
jgi:hypothetical protein